MGGAGSSLSTLTNGYPKPLLPILNRPMISYQLGLLEKHGFSEAILVVDGFDAEQADMLSAVVEYITEFNTKSKLRVRPSVREVRNFRIFFTCLPRQPLAQWAHLWRTPRPFVA